MTIELKKLELWFMTGSQHLYGEETLKQVSDPSWKRVGLWALLILLKICMVWFSYLGLPSKG